MNTYATLHSPDGNWTWEQYKITDIRPSKPGRLAKTPLELGTVSIDNKVVDPIEITVTGFIEAEHYDSYMEFLNEWRNNREWKFLQLISKFEIYDHLVLLNINPHETADKFDVAEVTCTLMQVMIENPKKKSSNPSNADTQSNGFVNGV